jgi:peptidoglycan-N-acetylglucosamine deacetylase
VSWNEPFGEISMMQGNDSSRVERVARRAPVHGVWALLLLSGVMTMGQSVEVGQRSGAVPTNLERPGVVLTFDDAYIAQWLAAQPIFAEYKARATFFVSAFDRLSPAQIAGVQQLRAAGHAIGCHGLRHLMAVDTVRRTSIREYLQTEIEPALALLRQAGITPTAFAYPSSQHDETTDAALAQYFRHLRSGTGVPAGKTAATTDAIFTPLADVPARRCLLGIGIDYAATQEPNEPKGLRLDDVCAALDRAAQRREIIVFYAHSISDKGPGHHLRPAVLKEILAHAAQAGLAFYTYDDLP